MKKILIIAICLLLTSFGAADAVTLSLTPSTNNILVGSTFLVDLTISDLGGENVGDFDIDVLFDSTQMSFLGYELGVSLGDASLWEALDLSWGEISNGTIDLAEVSLLSSSELAAIQTNEFVLATLTFQCIKEGVSMISIDNSDPNFTYNVGNQNGEQMSVTIANSAAVVQETPEPATVILLAGGLLGMFFLRKRFHSNV
jgi:hypothetical protein